MNTVYRTIVYKYRIMQYSIFGLGTSYFLIRKLLKYNQISIPHIQKVHALSIGDLSEKNKHFNFIADVVEISQPAVVFIEIHHKFHFDIFHNRPLVVSNGSGFIIDSNGLIVTNAHVVSQKNSKVNIKLYDGRSFEGVVEHINYQTDLALIRIKAHDLPTLKLGDSQKLRPGEFVVAMGSPLSLNNTVTFGVVSSTQRGSDELGIRGKDMTYIQTDAAINFGNSGGPLINLNGEVIGVNSMKVTAGISFAIPTHYLKELLVNVPKSKPEPIKYFLGVIMLTLQPDIIREFHIRNNLSTDVQHGVLIWKIAVDSPAFNSGLTSGDVIVAINDTKVTTVNDVFAFLNSSDIKVLKMTVYRKKNLIEIQVKPEILD